MHIFTFTFTFTFSFELFKFCLSNTDCIVLKNCGQIIRRKKHKVLLEKTTYEKLLKLFKGRLNLVFYDILKVYGIFVNHSNFKTMTGCNENFGKEIFQRKNPK